MRFRTRVVGTPGFADGVYDFITIDEYDAVVAERDALKESKLAADNRMLYEANRGLDASRTNLINQIENAEAKIEALETDNRSLKQDLKAAEEAIQGLLSKVCGEGPEDKLIAPSASEIMIMEKERKLTPCAKWTDDCQGKKDYDGRLLSISTRYWPGSAEQQKLVKEGLGFNMFDSTTREFFTHPYEPDGRPSATAAIVLNHGEPDDYGYADRTDWRRQNFVADTPEEVKRLVEVWVQERFDEIRSLLGIV